MADIADQTAQQNTPEVARTDAATETKTPIHTLQKSLEDELKTRVAFRIQPPGYRYPWHRWVIPMTCEIISSIGAIAIPVVVGLFIADHIAGNTQTAWPLFWVVIASIVVISANESLGWGTTLVFGAELDHDWNTYVNGLIGHTQTTVDAGEIVTIITKDIKNIRRNLFFVPLFTSALVTACLGAIQLWLVSPYTAAITFVGTAIVVWVLARYSRFLEKRIGTYRTYDGQNSSRAADIATGLRTITGLGAETQMSERYHNGADRVYESFVDYERVHRWMFFIRVLLTGIVTLGGIGFALTGHVENGQWVPDVPAASLVTVASIIAMMGGPIWVSQEFLTGWRYAKIGLVKIAKIEGYAGVRQGVLKKPRTDEEMAFFAAEVTKVMGQSTRVRVPAVSAKAVNQRIVYINPRAHNMTAQDYAQVLTAALRTGNSVEATENTALLDRTCLTQGENVLMSEPNPMIFAGTLREHLRLGTVPSDDSVTAQAKDEFLLQVTDSIEIAHRLGGVNPEDYYAARISSEGANLSGGQRQRLALARALAQQAQIMVLTEPLNSVDEPSQRYIYDRLEEHVGQRGQLGHIEKIYVVSTTAEVVRRIERDGYVVVADDGTIKAANEAGRTGNSTIQ